MTSSLEEFVQRFACQRISATAVTDEDLAPIGDPEVDVEQLEPGKAFIFTATVEVSPRLELTTEADYKGVQRHETVHRGGRRRGRLWVERLRRQFAELEPGRARGARRRPS